MALPLAAALGISAGSSLLGGLLGKSSAKRQARALEEASKPKPFEHRTERSPYGPAEDLLASLPAIAQGIFQRRLQQAPPPRFRGGGGYNPSANLQSIMDATRGRALSSSFVPSSQNYLLSRLGRPNPMNNEVFQRAMSYRNPYLDHFLDRGTSGRINSATPFMTGFLGNLLGGQTVLGSPPRRDDFLE
jgi:hypothetical protein